MRTLLVAVTAAWFIGGIWWISQPGSCACAAPKATTAISSASIIHLGPATDVASVDQPRARAVLEASTPIATAVAPAAPTAALVIPFTKNVGEFTPTPDQAEWCRAALDRLNADAGASILVTGHTDADGDAEWNRRLSAYRARLVMEGLVNAGIPADRIRAEGMGPDQPISDNLTSKGKAQNRRVEVSLVAQP